MSYYLLDESNQPVPCALKEWGLRFSDVMYKCVAKSCCDDGSWVSTVFLGMDHGFTETGKPVLWETMIFRQGFVEDFCQRYTSHEEAMDGHRRAVAQANEAFLMRLER